MGLLSNRLDRESLKPGDHIYSWRAAYLYAHHGIYVGDEKVIHFTRTGQKAGTGSVVDVLTVSSAPPPSLIPCPNCPPTNNTSGVTASCLDCFLAGGVLYRYEYSTNPAIFLAKPLDATCTLAPSDPPETVVFRANYLLQNGFGCYNVFKNNCEDFAIYCKTSLLVSDKKSMGQNAHVASVFGKTFMAAASGMLKFANMNIYVKTAWSVGSVVGTHVVSRYSYDISIRSDAIKVPVEEEKKYISHLSLFPSLSPLSHLSLSLSLSLSPLSLSLSLPPSLSHSSPSSECTRSIALHLSVQRSIPNHEPRDEKFEFTISTNSSKKREKNEKNGTPKHSRPRVNRTQTRVLILRHRSTLSNHLSGIRFDQNYTRNRHRYLLKSKHNQVTKETLEVKNNKSGFVTWGWNRRASNRFLLLRSTTVSSINPSRRWEDRLAARDLIQP
ncbi:hypothetical protein LXL04_014433 [Taraxacum kok-saghyz]